MSPDIIRILRERLELALQALEMGDDDRCGRLALSVAEAIAAKPVPPELADWPTWPLNTEVIMQSPTGKGW